jgi:hypothetical protein
MNRTTEAVQAQIRAMGSDFFEVGLFDPGMASREPVMILRTWDASTVSRSIPWLCYQNRRGRNIYIRPKGEHDLSLVDDLKASGVTSMKRSGFAPALVVETSPGNFQAWVKHSKPLPKQLGTFAAREIARRFGGDLGAADWRHFGRLSGLTNRKEKHRNPQTGLYPFVLLHEASGAVYPEASRFIAGIEQAFQRQVQQQAQTNATVFKRRPEERLLKSIDDFRSDPRYDGDGTRIDLAYAVYALGHGAKADEVGAVLRSRDLSHKGNERRQDEYVERTTRKALDSLRGVACGR